jgi:hypothetical protein
MAIYRFKVTFENYEDVFREIDIRSDQTFEDFFYAIQQSIGFDHQHEASFYLSNDQWKKGQEISTRQKDNHTVLLRDAVMHEWINDPHQKIYYIYDPENDWSFYIELVRILMKEDGSLSYPVCVRVNGEAPSQYVRQPAAGNTNKNAEKKLVADQWTGLRETFTDPQDAYPGTEDDSDIETLSMAEDTGSMDEMYDRESEEQDEDQAMDDVLQ